MAKRKYRSRLRKIFGRRLLIALMILFQLVFLGVMLFHSYQLYWVAALLTALSVATALHLMMRDDKSAFKLSLVFLILLFPIFGGVFYWVFHFQTATVGFRKRLERLAQKQRSEYSPSGDALERASGECARDGKLLRYLQTVPVFPVYQNTQTPSCRRGTRYRFFPYCLRFRTS